jgi:hypothetical protein
MKIVNFGVILGLTSALSGCAMFKPDSSRSTQASTRNQAPVVSQSQTENKDQAAFEKAANLTSGWPESSISAAKEMLSRYGDPTETTSDSLIWKNVLPFKKIIVHKEVYYHRFPLLHQNALEHVVDYKAPVGKVDDVWRYNGSIVLDRTKGEMSSFAENEAMNILGLNLANEVLSGRMGSESARITFGKETMNYLNGKRTAYTSVLNFGNQYQTSDPGETITTKIRWIGDPAYQRKPGSQRINTKQAQEEKKK